jgi:CheY-like chemotaxis protein
MAHVLVVDDDTDVRSVVRRVITKLGHQVWEAGDGAEALELLKKTRFDLIISDVYMADMDGMELLVRVQQLERNVPVVVMSGGGHMLREDVLKMASSCGAVATLDKPFTPEQLRDTVTLLLSAPGPEWRKEQ